MNKELNFKTHLLFQSITHDNQADTWFLNFSENLSFFVASLWRLIQERKIKFVSQDHGHKYSFHSEPVDLAKELTDLLSNQYLLEIKVNQYTSDILLELTNNIQIEIFITSAGFESYSFYLNKTHYYGMGSGELGIIIDNR